MAKFSPNLPFTVPLYLFIPTHKTIKGVLTKVYPKKGVLFFGSFKTFGGTETTVNGVVSVVDTATVETWYRPDIKSDCKIMRAEDGAEYEIINEPEDINMRHQYLVFKVKRIKGGA